MTTRVVRAVLEAFPLPLAVITHVIIPLIPIDNPDCARDRLFRACHTYGKVPPLVLQREVDREAARTRQYFVARLSAARAAVVAWAAQHAPTLNAAAVDVTLATFARSYIPGVRALFEVTLEAPPFPRIDKSALTSAVVDAVAIDPGQLPPLVFGLRATRSDPHAFVVVRSVWSAKSQRRSLSALGMQCMRHP